MNLYPARTAHFDLWRLAYEWKNVNEKIAILIPKSYQIFWLYFWRVKKKIYNETTATQHEAAARGIWLSKQLMAGGHEPGLYKRVRNVRPQWKSQGGHKKSWYMIDSLLFWLRKKNLSNKRAIFEGIANTPSGWRVGIPDGIRVVAIYANWIIPA